MLTANNRAIAWIGQTIAQQSLLLSYLDVFWAAAIFAFVMAPVALTLKSAKARPEGAE